MSPINTATGLGIVSISFALAVGQFVWGASQPIFGAIADKHGAVIIIHYLPAPKTAWTFYIFGATLGFTWLATVPPTAGLVGRLFGTRYLGTLFGLTLLSHQICGFFGAWLGGLSFATYLDFTWMWYTDIALAAAAALVNLPIREAPVLRGTAAQANAA